MKMTLRPITNSLRTGASVLATPVTSSVMGLEMLFVPINEKVECIYRDWFKKKIEL